MRKPQWATETNPTVREETVGTKRGRSERSEQGVRGDCAPSKEEKEPVRAIHWVRGRKSPEPKPKCAVHTVSGTVRTILPQSSSSLSVHFGSWTCRVLLRILFCVSAPCSAMPFLEPLKSDGNERTYLESGAQNRSRAADVQLVCVLHGQLRQVADLERKRFTSNEWKDGVIQCHCGMHLLDWCCVGIWRMSWSSTEWR